MGDFPSCCCIGAQQCTCQQFLNSSLEEWNPPHLSVNAKCRLGTWLGSH